MYHKAIMPSSEKETFYITTTLPYVNADPHIGFALEIIQADVIARYKRQQGYDVIFNTGTDEHGLKIYRRALEEKKDPQKYVDELAPRFERLKSALNLSYTHFIRTTDPHHKLAAQEFWKRCRAAGDIYKAAYHTKYCVGCELEKTDSELEDDRCPVHPNLQVEIIEEENYFFRFSKYEKPLLGFFAENSKFVLPEHRFNEVKNFVASGLRDFSISRRSEKMPWGVSVPDDPEHVMYVWFDALVNYISTLGWPEDRVNFSAYWPGMQVAGKDNLRQQAAMWQAMLLSAGIPNSKQIFIHGFITVDGEKMSKSRGNVIDPAELVQKYSTDSVRYYLLREIPSGEDGDFSYKKFEDRYNGDLANGLGNLVARVVTLATKVKSPARGEARLRRQKPKAKTEVQNIKLIPELKNVKENYEKAMEEVRLIEALEEVWKLIHIADKYVNEEKPWENKKPEVISDLLFLILEIASLLNPFLPETVEKIREQIKIADGQFEIKKSENLFPRL
ncbi:MAG: methionine--tRNA ligase [Candidatus Sungbacteria bacterium]|nr:methionine--tRNA ligase [Candidatus Sungbacteria bacterium]